MAYIHANILTVGFHWMICVYVQGAAVFRKHSSMYLQIPRQANMIIHINAISQHVKSDANTNHMKKAEKETIFKAQR